VDISGPLSLKDDLDEHSNEITITQSENGTFGLASTRTFRQTIFAKAYLLPQLSFGRAQPLTTRAMFGGVSLPTNSHLVASSTFFSQMSTPAFVASVKHAWIRVDALASVVP
jgi:hypothetical protein